MSRQQSSLVIKLIRSPIGYSERQKATVRALGLRRLQQEVERPDTSAVRGMIQKIQHLVEVREAAPPGRAVTRAEARPARRPAVEVAAEPEASADGTGDEAAAVSRRRRKRATAESEEESGEAS